MTPLQTVEPPSPPVADSAEVALARTVAREEVSSLCGLVLRRLQDGFGQDDIATGERLARILGEALRDFGSTASEPGG